MVVLGLACGILLAHLIHKRWQKPKFQALRYP